MDNKVQWLVSGVAVGLTFICLRCDQSKPAAPAPATQAQKPATQAATQRATAPVVNIPPTPPSNTAAATPTSGATSLSINAYDKLSQKDIDSITYDDIQDDSGFITPLAENLDNLDDDSKKRLDDWVAKLNDWPGSKEENVAQRVMNLLDVACLADMIHSEFEGETAYVIFDKLKSETDKEPLTKACAWIVLNPDKGKAVLKAPELGWDEDVNEDEIRERAAMYAKKLLGRLVGKLPPKQ